MNKFVLSALLFIVSYYHGYGSYIIVTVKDSIASNTTWSNLDGNGNCRQYLLKGTVYVTAGNTLTIDSATIIRGDRATKGTLVIEQGAKLICNGTINQPIVFTSNEPHGSRSFGDWGGIIICGRAPLNTNTSPLQFPGVRSYYGGANTSDNSGKLSYVRVEFAGIALSPNNELNGISFCGVGSGTQLDHIQVTMSGNDSYGWFGGTVNAKYLVSHRSWDDDFDAAQGYVGMNQFCVALRDPYAADISGSAIFECMGFETRIPTSPAMLTAPIFSNVTAVGPLVTTTTAYDPQHVAAVRWRRGAGLSVLNSVLMAEAKGIYIEEPASYPSTVGKIGNSNIQVRNNIIAGMATGNNEIYFKCDSIGMNCDTITGVNWSVITSFSGPWNWLKNASYMNVLYANSASVKLTNPFNLYYPIFIPISSSPVLTTVTPDFATTKASNLFFDKVNYVGAFGADNWLSGWTNFDPNNTSYDYLNCDGISISNIQAGIQYARLYPNPANEIVTLNLNIQQKTNLKIIITDMVGRTIAQLYDGAVNEGAKDFAINCKELNEGVYNVILITEMEYANLKLTVL